MLAIHSHMAKAFLFTVIVWVLGVGFGLLPGIDGSLYMFTPVLAVLIMMLVINRDGYTKKGWLALGLGRSGKEAWLFSLLVPLLPLAMGYGILWSTGWARFAMPETFHGFPWLWSPLVVALVFVKSAVLNVLAEELGWRGYLLPKLRVLGVIPAFFVSGLIHGLWHLPLILWTNAYHSGENPWISVPLFLATVLFLAPVIGYLRLKTDSVWPASLLHTSHNLGWMVFATFTSADTPVAEYIAGDSGAVILLFYMGMTCWVIQRLKRERLVI